MNTPRGRPETTFVVSFRAPADGDGIRALRALLKIALRRFGLRAVRAWEAPPQNHSEKLATADDTSGRTKMRILF
jgi:hypothetical protein